MSCVTYPGWPLSMVSGGFSSCPPPQDCCCESSWELRPGDLAPRAIDVNNWLKQNVADPSTYSVDDVLLSLVVTDLNAPTAMWPASTVIQPPVTGMPLVAGSYFTINSYKAYNAQNGRKGYSFDIKTDPNATVNSRLRLDYKFRVTSNCNNPYEGGGCVLINIRKCFTGVP